ncbi:MAG: ADP-ribosylglycohydrolase family protein [Victivallaceae bacterium]|nr:ADP-ribosylglycohydrolase family protein [Victivallaceae bacterium]
MDQKRYREKIIGAWLGKAVGGTLGQPWEGCSGPLNLSFYDPIPSGMIANDDLDVQVVWACKLAKEWNGEISRHLMAGAWPSCINNPCDEYGVAIRNLKLGLHAPHTGSYDNFFTGGMGAAIRSEIWACLAPGDPAKAAQFAYEDACVDHAGDGIYAEQFLAALESAAFTECGMRKLIETGLSVIPAESLLAAAITDTIRWCDRKCSFAELHTKIMTKYDNGNFTNVLVDLAFITAALLTGGGDFVRTICLAVNFGQDADCTGATTGSIMGILNPDGIPKEWLAPIGRDLVVSPGITGIQPPSTLDEFTDLVAGLRPMVHLGTTKETKGADLSRFAIAYRRSVFQPWFPRDPRKFHPVMAENAAEGKFPGNLVEIDFSDAPMDSLVLYEVPFHLDAPEQEVIVLVSTAADLRVWVDGQFLFACESGPMLPAFHRAPMNHRRDVTLSGGAHTLRFGVARSEWRMQKTPLLFGLASMDCHWIPEAFLSR